jgi:hypothetical protein
MNIIINSVFAGEITNREWDIWVWSETAMERFDVIMCIGI